ncbi:MAG: response regulator [Planctomycetaceae bacterium]|jgi:PAS domain S-box-containing protein|nr:response regulator [Planctomycetaceae bacterium]
MTWFLNSQNNKSDSNSTNTKFNVIKVLSLSGIGVWNCDIENQMLYFAHGFLERYGYLRSEVDKITLDNWLSLILPEDVEQVSNHLKGFFSGESCGNIDYICRLITKPNNSPIWIHIHGIAFAVDTDGVPIRAGGTIQDITKIKEAERSLEIRDKLSSATNEVAKILLDEYDDFTKQIWHSLKILGDVTGVDNVYVWKNHTGKDGRLYTAQLYEWSSKSVSGLQQSDGYLVDIPFEEAVSPWHEILLAGKCVNNIVSSATQVELNYFKSRCVCSILVTPIMFRDELWGFIGFEDSVHERTWNDVEISILQSAGMLIASAIIRCNTHESLQVEQALMRRIFETSPTGVIITTNGILKLQNKIFAAMHGTKIGDSVRNIYVDSVARSKVENKIKSNPTVINHPVQLHCADGIIRDFLMTYQVIQYKGETSWLCWEVDITELKNSERAMKIARDWAEEGTKAKGEFLARMSHEIRTPMNAILGMTYLCLQTELTDKQRDYLQKTQTATMNLLEIIDDILDFSKIEAGKIEIESIQFHLSEVLRDVINIAEIRVNEKGLELRTNVSERVYDHLIGDPTRLRQILTNLVNNAVKFTENGSVTINIDVFFKDKNKRNEKSVTTQFDDSCDSDNVNLTCNKNGIDDSNNTLKDDNSNNTTLLMFEVFDTGIGMTEEQVSNLFKSFTQADGSMTRKYGGTGLGLVIVKNLVELMGGTIGVKSQVGKGSMFWFILPFTKVTGESVNCAVAKTNFEGRRILVADDDPVAREHLRELIVSLSMRVDLVDSGESAIAALVDATRTNNHYDLTLIDWKMPRLDGIETIRRIRISSDIVDQPQILMISAYDRGECLRQSRDLAIAGFLVKPITIRDLSAAFSRVFNVKETIPEVKNVEQVKDKIEGKKILLVEDNKINQVVAKEILRLLGVNLVIANNGMEAVEAVQKEDFDLILMDIQMPVMDGLTATKKIRELNRPGLSKVPILAMTANAMDVDYQKSIESGMDDHLTKPIDPIKLKNALELWIGKRNPQSK